MTHEDGCAEAPCSGCAYLRAEVERLQQWVNDLQAGMYINCVYCGHQYGPEDEVPATMAEVLKDHIAVCPKHPLAEARAECGRLRSLLEEALDECCPGWREHPPLTDWTLDAAHYLLAAKSTGEPKCPKCPNCGADETAVNSDDGGRLCLKCDVEFDAKPTGEPSE